jgi:hypothetical protein
MREKDCCGNDRLRFHCIMLIYWPQWESNGANDASNYDGTLWQLWMDYGVTATFFNIEKFQVGMTWQRHTSLHCCQNIKPVSCVFSDINAHNWCIWSRLFQSFTHFLLQLPTVILMVQWHLIPHPGSSTRLQAG